MPKNHRTRIAVRFGDSECWFPVTTQGPVKLLTASSNGYVPYRAKDRTQTSAHRYWREVVAGPIPVGKEPDHTCRVRGCCAPSHLEPVDHSTNILRGNTPAVMRARHAATRAREYCKHGHSLADAYYWMNRGVRERHCRTCETERKRRMSCRPRS